MSKAKLVAIVFIAALVGLGVGTKVYLDFIMTNYPSVYAFIADWIGAMWIILAGSGIYWGWRWAKGTYPPDLKKFVDEKILDEK